MVPVTLISQAYGALAGLVDTPGQHVRASAPACPPVIVWRPTIDVPAGPVFTEPERLALAGFLACCSGLTREAHTLDLRQFSTWCHQHSLRLFTVRRADIECFARDLEAKGRADKALQIVPEARRYATDYTAARLWANEARALANLGPDFAGLGEPAPRDVPSRA